MLIFLSTAIQQCCITHRYKQRYRLNRLLLVIINLCFYSTTNALLYIAIIYPNKTIISSSITITTICLFIQLIQACIGNHTFCLLCKWILDTMYNPTGNRPPKWLKHFINTMEVIMIVSALFFHWAAIITDNLMFMFIYYVFLSTEILILSFFALIQLMTPLKLLKQIPQTSVVIAAITKIKGAQCIIWVIIVLGIIDIISTLNRVVGFVEWSYDKHLEGNMQSSAELWFFSISLILWIYLPGYCCKIPKHSICHECCYQKGGDRISVSGAAVESKNQNPDVNFEAGLMDEVHSINGIRDVSHHSVTPLND